MRIGMIGLGRMGANMVRRLMNDGHECVVFDVNEAAVRELEAAGATGSTDLARFVELQDGVRHVWMMIPAGLVDDTIAKLAPMLASGDVLVDGGNSYFKDDLRRANELAARGIRYVDCGVSGGVWGLERGYCIMAGGPDDAVAELAPALASLAPGRGDVPPTEGFEAASTGTPSASAMDGWLHCGPSGAGHFVKMVHNGIEYGIMAAYAEGLNILQRADLGTEDQTHDAETTPLREPEAYQYDLDLAAITELWRRGSVIGSWLLDLTARALARDATLAEFSGRVSDSGEGRWTVQAGIDLGVPTHVLTSSLYERFSSRGNATFADQVTSAMRKEFGGHSEKKD